MSFFAFAWYAACALFWLVLLIMLAAIAVGVLGIVGSARETADHDRDDGQEYR